MELQHLLNPFLEAFISGSVLLVVWLVKRTVDNNHAAHDRLMDRLEEMAAHHNSLSLRIAEHDSTLARHGARLDHVENEVDHLRHS